MRTTCASLVRCLVPAILALAALAATPSSAWAQLGVGGRLAWVAADSDADLPRVRFVGGQIRLLSPRWGLEVSLDRHSEEFEALNEKVVETPIQTSLLLRLGNGRVTPFLLGGPGWYRRKVEALDGSGAADLTSTEFGWHAGIGLEGLIGRHVGIHGDYRYTFLDFNGDDGEDEGLIGRVLPGHRGSMWTLGATIYF
ncbi:MAG TPA: outer membrane beta-barrel protein [Vicinamibacterales bacterium]|nr:outer membrane beta-barrel protein [Vicinamibacterales bacterium]